MQTIFISDKSKHLPPKLLSACGIGDGAWIAGGAARCLFLGSPLNDVDVWYSNVGKWSEASNRVNQHRISSPYTTDNAVTVNINVDWEPETTTGVYKEPGLIDKLELSMFSKSSKQSSEYKVQLIRKKFYSSLTEIFNDFDFSVCKIATDGQGTFIFGDQALEDLAHGRLRCTKYLAEGFITRFIKYNIYGYKMPAEELHSFLNQPDLDWTVKDESATY
jgi:hypothetical protein